LHGGLRADSSDSEVRALLHQLDDEVGVNDEATIGAGWQRIAL
jgi:hypothetical protein